jgi:DNA-binding PadR family transcriptional regulator
MVPRNAKKKRPITLPSRWLVLALVIERPSHAYEIGARYKRQFGSFAPMDSNGVYGALDRLVEHALVIPTVAGPLGGRGTHSRRVVYEPTHAGPAAHKRWLLSSVRKRHWRPELLARIATGAVLTPSELLALINLYEQLTVVHSQQIPPPPQTHSDELDGLAILVRQLVAEEQNAVISAQLNWVKKVRDRLQHSPA